MLPMIHRLVRTSLALWLSTASLRAAPVRDSVWRASAGDWTQPALWSAGCPDGLVRAVLGGKAQVTLASGLQVCGGLRVATGRGESARLLIRGGALVVRRDFISVGELDGGAGEIVLEGGALHASGATYLAAANSELGRRCRGTLRIRGGSYVTRVLTLGWGPQSEAVFAVEGSQVEAVHVLDYVTLGTYQARPPSTSVLAFTLDEQGVTPITIQSRGDGLRIVRDPAANVCRLEVQLRAVPPRGDVTLVAAQVPTRGQFDDLAEGAEVRATHAGREFRWTLTYRGGPNACHVVLCDVRGHEAADPSTRPRPLPARPAFLWEKVPLREPLPAVVEPAFAGAAGFGAGAAGGRGGREIAVRTLADAGPGSLREAIETRGPRIVRFRVSGEIRLRSPLRITEPRISILGQSAPGDGVVLRGRGLVVQTSDVVLRHLRIRPGAGSGDDAVEFRDAERCLADRCSFLWGDDETCSIVGLSDAITIQHCLIAEGLNHAGHSMAAIAGGERTTWHRNVFAHCRSRNPRFAGQTVCDFRHNVIYDWGDTAAYGEFEQLNVVGNWFKPGPSTTQKPLLIFSSDAVLPAGSFFVRGNSSDAVRCDEAARAQRPFAAPAVPGAATFDAVLEQAGATLPVRDAVDARVLREVRDGTGRIIDRE